MSAYGNQLMRVGEILSTERAFDIPLADLVEAEKLLREVLAGRPGFADDIAVALATIAKMKRGPNERMKHAETAYRSVKGLYMREFDFDAPLGESP